VIGDADEDFVRYNQSVGLTDLDPIYVPAGRNAKELKEMQRKAYAEFYFRPVILWRHLPHIRFSLVLGLLRSFLAMVRLRWRGLRKSD
jgi:hypothetical protein